VTASATALFRLRSHALELLNESAIGVTQRRQNRQQIRHAWFVDLVEDDLPAGICDSGFDLANVERGIVKQLDNAGRCRQRLAHLRHRLGKISNSADRGQDVGLRNDERRAVAGVEAQREVTGELEMLALVLPHWHLIGLIQQDVGGHQHRISEQAHIGGFWPHLGGLVLELRHSLRLPESRQATEHPVELRVFRNM
jgi:hypothetical protein